MDCTYTEYTESIRSMGCTESIRSAYGAWARCNRNGKGASDNAGAKLRCRLAAMYVHTWPWEELPAQAGMPWVERHLWPAHFPFQLTEWTTFLHFLGF